MIVIYVLMVTQVIFSIVILIVQMYVLVKRFMMIVENVQVQRRAMKLIVIKIVLASVQIKQDLGHF